MVFSVENTVAPALATSDLFRPKLSSPKHRSHFLSISKPQHLPTTSIYSCSLRKALHISASSEPGFFRARDVQVKERLRVQALEGDGSVVPEQPKSAKLNIGIYFATWWALNVVFNIYNKKVLNAFPYPWLTSTLSLAAGSLIMLISWGTRIAEPPKTDPEFWKALAPVAIAHTIGHVAATVSMSKVAVSFTHIIKSGEPAFSVLVSRFLLGETFPTSVYLSLIPIIGGCSLAALTELNFNMIGFMGAMISNIAFVFRNIFSKKGMTGKSVSGMNYYACLSMLSLLILTPFALAVEGPAAWAAGWKEAVSTIGPNFVWWVAAQSVFYHLYNQVSYMSLDQITPLTFSIGNTMKRVSVIVSSIIIFRTPVQPINCLGAAIAILGTFLYSQYLATVSKIEVNVVMKSKNEAKFIQCQKCSKKGHAAANYYSRLNFIRFSTNLNVANLPHGQSTNVVTIDMVSRHNDDITNNDEFLHKSYPYYGQSSVITANGMGIR